MSSDQATRHSGNAPSQAGDVAGSDAVRAGTQRSWRSVARSSVGVGLALARLGKRIRGLREKLSLSQEKAAAGAQIDPKHWQVIEQGGTNPTVASLVAISRALRVPLKDLF